jgi:hypothetical protein
MNTPYGYKVGSGVMHKRLNVNATIVEFRTNRGTATPAEIAQLVPDLYVCVKDTKGDLLGWHFKDLADFPRTPDDGDAAPVAPTSGDGDLRVLVANMARELAAMRKEVTRLTADNAALQAKVDALTPKPVNDDIQHVICQYSDCLSPVADGSKMFCERHMTPAPNGGETAAKPLVTKKGRVIRPGPNLVATFGPAAMLADALADKLDRLDRRPNRPPRRAS